MSHAGSCLGFICTCKTEDALKRSDQYHDVEVQKFIQIIELLKAENERLKADLEIIRDWCDRAFSRATEALRGE